MSSGGERGQEYLKCVVHGFYPNVIKIRWTQKGRPIYFGVSTPGILPHKDGTFQMTSYLSLGNVSAHDVTCETEHLSIDGKLKSTYGKSLTRAYIINLSIMVNYVKTQLICSVSLFQGRHLCFCHKSQNMYLRQWLPFFLDLHSQCA